MRHSLRMLIGEELESKVEIGLAKDGSGVGGKLQYSSLSNNGELIPQCNITAALCALVATKEALVSKKEHNS